MQKTY